MGIDPGTRHTGYAVIEKKGNRLTPVCFGVISPSIRLSFEIRLKEIYEKLLLLMDEHNLSAVSIEKLYSHKSAMSAVKLGHARGVAILAASMSGLEVFEYSPALIKKSLTGFGNAPKEQMQEMAKRLLALKEIPKPDAADAIGIAICHIHHS